MDICKVCGTSCCSIRTHREVSGPPDLDRPATMKDIRELRILVAAFRADVLKLLAKMAREQ